MTDVILTPGQLKAEVRAAWADVEAPPPQDMRVIDWEYGEEAARTFVGVRPENVDIDSVGFMAATPLLHLPADAAAAYLGPYLVSLIEGFQIEEADGFSIDLKTRSHTLYTLSSPNFWLDIAAPNLSTACVSALRNVTRFIIGHADIFQLSEEEERGLQRLIRSIDRQLTQARDP